jgi:hypothetical protein
MSLFSTSGRSPLALAGALITFAMVVTVYGGDDVRIVHPVPAANPANPPADAVQPNRIADNFAVSLIARGSDPLENPVGGITSLGLLADGTRTEPDQNLYLTFDHDPGGPTPGYRYGHHFLYQGHENAGDRAYITRINLDVADPAHRITLLTLQDPTGFNAIDGSTWDPFTRTLLFTQENGAKGGVIEVTPEWPAVVRTLDGILGKGGYEGIHPDDNGNLIIIEDVGGTSVNVVQGDTTSAKTAKQPNSFVYWFEPYHRWDLSVGGKLFALQVSIDHTPVVFGSDPVADVFSTAQLKLHTPHATWPAAWVLLHDTAVDGFASFDANALAKQKLATPFKRPENAEFLPGSGFRTFYFCPTGDTDINAGSQPALAARGSWGSIFKAHFPRGSHRGSVSLVVLGDIDHASFDNLAFADDETLLATEDRGDTLHDQADRLDSVWAFDIDGNRKAQRLIALGRDSVSAPVGEEDNEPTGLHVSNGSSSEFDILGTHDPSDDAHRLSLRPHRADYDPGWFFEVNRQQITPARWFLTQQHGLNRIFEIVRKGW